VDTETGWVVVTDKTKVNEEAEKERHNYS